MYYERQRRVSKINNAKDYSANYNDSDDAMFFKNVRNSCWIDSLLFCFANVLSFYENELETFANSNEKFNTRLS